MCFVLTIVVLKDLQQSMLGFELCLPASFVSAIIKVVSLGQGQGSVAEALVHLSMHNGDWVCLQVSHSLITTIIHIEQQHLAAKQRIVTR